MAGITRDSLCSVLDDIGGRALLVSVPDMRIVHANREFLSEAGMILEDLRERNCHEANHGHASPCDIHGVDCPVKTAMETGMPSSAVHLHAGKDGRGTLVDVSSRPIHDESGKVAYVILVLRGSAEQETLPAGMKSGTRFLENILQGCPDGIVGNDRRGNIFLFNEGAERIFGYTGAEVIGRIGAKDLYPPGGAHDVWEHIFSEQHGGHGRLVDFETIALGKGGRRIPIRLCCSVVQESGRETDVIGFFTDITERKAMEADLRTLSITDGLTRLYNRRHFQSLAQKEVERVNRSGGCSSLLLIDVDDFKQYNDAHGHAEGDAVLRALGNLIGTSIRAADTGFRFGGEEFAAILPDTMSQQAVVPAERLRTAFEAIPCMPADGGGPFTVTISIGIAEITAGRTVDDIIRFADAAMYAAKNGGRNRTVVHGVPLSRHT